MYGFPLLCCWYKQYDSTQWYYQEITYKAFHQILIKRGVLSFFTFKNILDVKIVILKVYIIRVLYDTINITLMITISRCSKHSFYLLSFRHHIECWPMTLNVMMSCLKKLI